MKSRRNFYSALRPSVNALFGQPLALSPFYTPHGGAARLARVLFFVCCPSSTRLKFREAQPSDLHFPPEARTYTYWRREQRLHIIFVTFKARTFFRACCPLSFPFGKIRNPRCLLGSPDRLHRPSSESAPKDSFSKL